MDAFNAWETISRMFDQEETRILSESEIQMKEFDDAKYRIEKQYDFLEDMLSLYNSNSENSLLLVRKKPIYTMDLVEIDNILSVNPFLNMKLSMGLYAEFEEIRDNSIHLVLGKELSITEDYDLSPSIPAFEGRSEDDTRTDSEKYSPLRLDSKKGVTLLPFLDRVFSYVNGFSSDIGDAFDIAFESVHRESETFRQIDSIADRYHSIDSLDDVCLHEGKVHIKLSGDFSDRNKFFKQYMPEGKDAFNPVFFMKPKDDRIAIAVTSPELIPVGNPLLVTA